MFIHTSKCVQVNVHSRSKHESISIFFIWWLHHSIFVINLVQKYIKKQHQYKDAISTNFARLGLLSLKTISLCLEPCKDTIIISCLLPYQFIENK